MFTSQDQPISAAHAAIEPNGPGSLEHPMAHKQHSSTRTVQQNALALLESAETFCLPNGSTGVGENTPLCGRELPLMIRRRVLVETTTISLAKGVRQRQKPLGLLENTARLDSTRRRIARALQEVERMTAQIVVQMAAQKAALASMRSSLARPVSFGATHEPEQAIPAAINSPESEIIHMDISCLHSPAALEIAGAHNLIEPQSPAIPEEHSLNGLEEEDSKVSDLADSLSDVPEEPWSPLDPPAKLMKLGQGTVILRPSATPSRGSFKDKLYQVGN